MSKDIKRVEAPNLIAFVEEIQNYVKQGYTIMDTNEGVPQSFGFGLYTCELEKDGAKTSSEAPQEPKQEAKPTTQETEEKAAESVSEAVTEAPTKPKRKTSRKGK